MNYLFSISLEYDDELLIISWSDTHQIDKNLDMYEIKNIISYP